MRLRSLVAPLLAFVLAGATSQRWPVPTMPPGVCPAPGGQVVTGWRLPVETGEH